MSAFDLLLLASAGGPGPGRFPEPGILLPALAASIVGLAGIPPLCSRLWQAGKDRLEEGEAMMFMTDSATGLYSRGYVMDYLRNAMLRSFRSRAPVTLLLFEQDREGEPGPGRPPVAWRRVTDAFRTAIRPGDMLGRIRANEILLVPSGPLPCPLHLMHRAMERVRCRTGERLRAGIARSPEDGLDPALLLEAARRSLEWMKKGAA